MLTIQVYNISLMKYMYASAQYRCSNLESEIPNNARVK